MQDSICERVVAALNHQETDRVPIDLGSTIVTTVTRTAYQNLLEHLDLPPDDGDPSGSDDA